MEAHDPLADAPPPRYAVESDDEDEYGPSSKLQSRSEQAPRPEVKVEFKSMYGVSLSLKRPLVFASGEAGASWAKIVNLGEQQAGIYVNDHSVGMLFRPTWTSATVIVSEAETCTRLPIFAITTYAIAVLAHLQPVSVAVLDSYPAIVYISPQVIPQDSAPIRYLSTGKQQVPDSELELFAPPNLLQSTTASLLNELFLRSNDEGSAQDLTATMFLLPSHRVPPPSPTSFNGRITAREFSDTIWARETLERAHRCLFAIVGEEVDKSTLRTRAEPATRPLLSAVVSRSTLGEVGEGGMYI